MIIDMNDYRRIDSDYDSGADADCRRVYGNDDRRSNAVLAPQLATAASEWQDSPNLPVDFDDFNAREFIERAYGLATQI